MILFGTLMGTMNQSRSNLVLFLNVSLISPAIIPQNSQSIESVVYKTCHPPPCKPCHRPCFVHCKHPTGINHCGTSFTVRLKLWSEVLQTIMEYLDVQSKAMKTLHAHETPVQQISDALCVKYVHACSGPLLYHDLPH